MLRRPVPRNIATSAVNNVINACNLPREAAQLVEGNIVGSMTLAVMLKM